MRRKSYVWIRMTHFSDIQSIRMFFGVARLPFSRFGKKINSRDSSGRLDSDKEFLRFVRRIGLQNRIMVIRHIDRLSKVISRVVSSDSSDRWDRHN